MKYTIQYEPYKCEVYYTVSHLELDAKVSALHFDSIYYLICIQAFPSKLLKSILKIDNGERFSLQAFAILQDLFYLVFCGCHVPQFCFKLLVPVWQMHSDSIE